MTSKITNKVTNPNYTQWIGQFVKDVLKYGHVDYKEVTIEDIELSKRIYLTVDE